MCLLQLLKRRPEEHRLQKLPKFEAGQRARLPERTVLLSRKASTFLQNENQAPPSRVATPSLPRQPLSLGVDRGPTPEPLAALMHSQPR